MKFLKKHYKFLIFILICLTIFLIFKINNHHNMNYTSLGDSFSLGEDAYGRIDYGYSDYVKDYLANENKLNRYIKSFSTKQTSINSLYQDIVTNKKIKLDNHEVNIKQTLRETNILTLSVGLNDLIYQLSITQNLTEGVIDKIIFEIEKDFNRLITEIKKYYTQDIYVVGYYNIYPENQLYEKSIKKLNKIYKNNKDVIYIDTYTLFENNKEYLPNFFNYHPNREGNVAISKLIIEKITKKLEK